MKNNLTNKKWIKLFFVFSFIGIGLIGTINYVIDPFNVFHTGFFQYQYQMNERFIKIEHLEDNHHKYNSYIFGSSRIAAIRPEIIEKFIPNSKFYNFTISAANMYDYHMHLKYFLNRKYSVKNIYLEIDIDNMKSYGRSESDYLRKLHPYVVNETLYSFYLHYLSGFFPLNIMGKIENNIKHKNEWNYHFETTGTWTRPEKEKRIEKNCLQYISNEPTFNKKRARTIRSRFLDKTIEALKNIKKLSDQYNINLIIYTTPHNQNMMDLFVVQDYLEFLKKISEVTDFYDFSGYNTITMDNCNYYESSHYRPYLGNIIANHIFGEKKYSDIGILVTKNNIEQHLKKQKLRILKYESDNRENLVLESATL